MSNERTIYTRLKNETLIFWSYFGPKFFHSEILEEISVYLLLRACVLVTNNKAC